MQEDIERRTVAIVMTTSKFTSRTLAQACQSALRQIRTIGQNKELPHGRQSVGKLMDHGVNTNTIPLDGSTRMFDRVAKKYNVDYAFEKIAPKKYLLCFKAGQADMITHCFSEYVKRVTKQQQRPSMKKRMEHYTEKANRDNKSREHERTRGRGHGDR